MFVESTSTASSACRSGSVLRVAGVQLGEHLLVRRHVALLDLLAIAAAGAFLRRSRQKDLHRRVDQHPRADVPAVDQHVRRRGDFALRGHHAAANRRPFGNGARRGGNLARADQVAHVLPAQHRPLRAVPIRHAHIRLAAVRGDRLLILRVDPVSEHVQRDGAIHRARVQMQNMKPLRHLIGDRGFPRAHRAVDGNVHRHISFPPVWLLVQPSFFYYTLQARFCSSPRPDLGVILHFYTHFDSFKSSCSTFCSKSTFFSPLYPIRMMCYNGFA